MNFWHLPRNSYTTTSAATTDLAIRVFQSQQATGRGQQVGEDQMAWQQVEKC